MDWSRTGSIADIIIWGLLSAGVWAGGWLLCAHVFRLRSRERLMAGLALGMLLYILAANLLVQLLPTTAGFVAAALLIAAFGMLAAWQSTARPRFPVEDFGHTLLLASFAVLFLVFLKINRGLAIFDDYAHLPLVSMLASGDIPPHFYLNPEIIADYHYGANLPAAALVRVGGFYPWAALDIFKALTIALAAVLGTLWLRRYSRPGLAIVLGAGAMLFAGGTRWLLLFIAQDTLRHISAGIEMLGSAMQTAPSLPDAMLKTWRIAGDGPISFPFAFVNGISMPLTFAMGSGGAMPLMTLYLLLLLGRRRWSRLQAVTFGLAITALALISEHWFAVLWGGVFLAVALAALYRRSWRIIWEGAWLLLPGALLAPLMGGVLTNLFRRALDSSPSSAVGASVWLPGIALRWPPAVLSSHLGELQLTRPEHLLLALAEIGPILLLGPVVTLAAWKNLRSRKLLQAGLAIMALVSLLLPIFVRFTERDRDISRLTSGALSIWLILGLPYLWRMLRSKPRWARTLASLAYFVTIFSGLALLPIQLIAGFQPRASNFVEEPDIWMAQKYWNQLEPGAWVLDTAYPYRPAALFARTTGPAYQSVYIEDNDFLALLGDPSVTNVSQAGYRYVYVDRKTWGGWKPELRRGYSQGCAALLAERKTAEGDFRRLYDLQACANAAP